MPIAPWTARNRKEGTVAESQPVSEEVEEEGDLLDSPWAKLLVGGVLVWAGYYCRSLFLALETGETESARIHWVLALLYNELGPDVAVWSVWGLAGVMVVWGLAQLVGGSD